MRDGPTATVPLFCRDAGSGPAVLLLHGLGADHTIWNPVVPLLADRFRVLAPDLRGHGRSTAPDGASYRFEGLEADVSSLLQKKGVASAHLVGLSAGALLALRIGLDMPERARSVTLVGGAAYTDGHSRAIVERWSETYAREGLDALAVRLLKDLYYPAWIEAHVEVADQLRKEIGRRDHSAAFRWAREVGSFDERARVGSLKPPALILQAMDDAVVDPSHGRLLRQSIPGSRIRILSQTGHMIPIERPEEFADAVAAFVREVEEGRHD